MVLSGLYLSYHWRKLQNFQGIQHQWRRLLSAPHDQPGVTNSKSNTFAKRTERINISLYLQPFPTPLLGQRKAESRLPNPQRDYIKIWYKCLIAIKNFSLFFLFIHLPGFILCVYALFCNLWGRRFRYTTLFQMEEWIIYSSNIRRNDWFRWCTSSHDSSSEGVVM